MDVEDLSRGANRCPYPEITTIDARKLPVASRQPLLLAAFARLEVGQAYRLVSDHEPVPICARLEANYPDQVVWEYVDKGPEVWSVRIGRRAQARTRENQSPEAN